ncbi:hypothetical protein LCGC14_2935170, partial [marine sediment metagenome]
HCHNSLGYKVRPGWRLVSWRFKMDELLKFHEEQRPDLLIVRAAKRLKQLEGEAE